MKNKNIFSMDRLSWLSPIIILVTGMLALKSPNELFLVWGYMAGILLTVMTKRKIYTLLCAGLAVVFVLSTLLYNAPEEMSFRVLFLNALYSFIGLGVSTFFVLRSISLERKALDNKTKMSGIFLYGTQGILLINSQGIIVMANPYAERLFSFDPGELNGNRIEEIIPSIAVGRYSNARKDITGQRKDKSSIPIEISSNEFESGRAKFVVVFVTDITTRVQNEEFLLAKQNELESVNSELEAFAYSVSHDLRSPLRGVAGYTKMLEEDYGDSLDAEGKRLLGIIQQSAENMGVLIDDLLAFSRLGKKGIRKFTVNMNELFEKVLFEINSSTPNKARINMHPLHPAFADQTLIYHVLANLLSNAIKYSAKVEHPVVDIGSSEQQGEIIYYIRDNGAGFDMKYAHKLFGVFQRLHTHEEFDGTGVGLAIAHRIIQKHGGKIWAEGKEGEGATFFFSLPGSDEHTYDNESGGL